MSLCGLMGALFCSGGNVSIINMQFLLLDPDEGTKHPLNRKWSIN